MLYIADGVEDFSFVAIMTTSSVLERGQEDEAEESRDRVGGEVEEGDAGCSRGSCPAG